MTSSFLYSGIAKAATLKDTLFEQKGILTKDFSGEDKTTFLGIGELINNLTIAINWLKDIKQHIYDFSIDIFSFVFEMLMVIGLQTPSFIFNNPYTINTTVTFSLISISIIILLTIYESIIQMFSKVSKKSYTPFMKIMKRLPIAIGISGFAPFLFQQAFKLLNKITRGITGLGGNIFKQNNFSEIISLSGIDVLGMVLFDIVALGLIIPILLQGGRRWWDLFCLCVASPLALTAWIFDRHRHMFNIWFNSIKRLSMIQLVIATFIVLMGLFLYGARFIAADLWAIKILIILGALYRIANPPNFVKSYTRGEQDVVELFDSYKKTAQGVYNTVTLKNLKPLNFYRKQKTLAATKTALRMKHGKRFVDNLIK
ncbi:hypothetical protein LCM23_06315 [Cytobacillus kochii]|uniref:conjugal transfer protein TrbL family protein n=1 Tax=Cytobacillus kochii TaxID=859143 RepID=UPI001CD6C47A|nr:conjugal transfer protein TrbL family protein [Cytobacillus kochii]MCA1025699.1 hypothetical protein [Cytobacillus kochii]